MKIRGVVGSDYTIYIVLVTTVEISYLFLFRQAEQRIQRDALNPVLKPEVSGLHPDRVRAVIAFHEHPQALCPHMLRRLCFQWNDISVPVLKNKVQFCILLQCPVIQLNSCRCKLLHDIIIHQRSLKDLSDAHLCHAVLLLRIHNEPRSASS